MVLKNVSKGRLIMIFIYNSCSILELHEQGKWNKETFLYGRRPCMFLIPAYEIASVFRTNVII